MTSRTFAVILVRMLGLWLVLHASFTIAELLSSAWMMRSGSAGAGWTSYPPLDLVTSASELYVNDTYYVITHASLIFLAPALKITFGVLLIVTARRVARLICSGLEEP